MFQVAIARHRLGDTPYLIESRHRRTAASLAAKGLVWSDAGSVQGTIKIALTPLGEIVGISEDYTPAALSARCPSFYLGPKTGGMRWECDATRHHDEPHTSTLARADGSAILNVTWSEQEADGRADPLWGPRVAKAEREAAETRQRIRDAIAEHRLDWATGSIIGSITERAG